jgi:hypothetical protein
MSRESNLTRADQQARYVINTGHTFDVGRLIADIDVVSEQDVVSLAQHIFQAKPTLAVIGHTEGLLDYDSIRQKLAG